MNTLWLIYTIVINLPPFIGLVLLIRTWRNSRRLAREMKETREHFVQELDRLLAIAPDGTERRLIIALRKIWTQDPK